MCTAVTWLFLCALSAYYSFKWTQNYQTWDGFISMYQIFLENSIPKLAPALELLADPNRLPALVHCVHGKDRTGVYVAITQLLSGATTETVALDYSKSCNNLACARDHLRTAKIADPKATPTQMFLLKNAVINSPKQVMIDLISWMREGVYEALNKPELRCWQRRVFGGRLDVPKNPDPRARSGERLSAQHSISLMLQATGMKYTTISNIVFNMGCPLAGEIQKLAQSQDGQRPIVEMDKLQVAHFTVCALAEGYRSLEDICDDLRHCRIQLQEMQERLGIYTMVTRNQLLKHAHSIGVVNIREVVAPQQVTITV